MNDQRISGRESTSGVRSHRGGTRQNARRKLPWWSSGVAMLLMLCLLLAACGSSGGSATAPTSHEGQSNPAQVSPSPAAKAGIDPCSLISNAQASQVLGAQVTGSPGEALPQCAYQDTAHSSQILVKVGTSQDARGYYQLLQSQASNASTISGIGDAAFYSAGIAGNLYTYVFGSSITVLTGKAVFNIALTDAALNDAATRAASVKLAQDAEGVVTATLHTLAAPQPDPCTLVTKDEVSQLFGGIAVQTLNGLSGGANSCTYSTPSARDFAFTAVQTYATAGDAKQFFESTKPPGTKEVGGIGDDAFFDALGSLEVLKGHTVLGITVSGTSPSAAEASEEQLAQNAISRL
jgi:hypothetical protein